MTVSQVAEALGLTVFQVYARRSKGQLPFQFARVTGVGERAALYARADDVHALAASAEEAA